MSRYRPSILHLQSFALKVVACSTLCQSLSTQSRQLCLEPTPSRLPSTITIVAWFSWVLSDTQMPLSASAKCWANQLEWYIKCIWMHTRGFRCSITLSLASHSTQKWLVLEALCCEPLKKKKATDCNVTVSKVCKMAPGWTRQLMDRCKLSIRISGIKTSCQPGRPT